MARWKARSRRIEAVGGNEALILKRLECVNIGSRAVMAVDTASRLPSCRIPKHIGHGIDDEAPDAWSYASASRLFWARSTHRPHGFATFICRRVVVEEGDNCFNDLLCFSSTD